MCGLVVCLNKRGEVAGLEAHGSCLEARGSKLRVAGQYESDFRILASLGWHSGIGSSSLGSGGQ